MANPDFSFDLYLSYCPADARWARTWLLPRLERAGLRVFVDERDARPGASKIAEIERAVLESAKTLIVLSPAYLQSEWNDFQSILIQHLDPAARQQRLIPLILRETELPLRLNMLVPVDFSDPAQREGQLGRLLGALGGRGAGELGSKGEEELGSKGEEEQGGKGEEEQGSRGEEEQGGRGEEEPRERPVGLPVDDPAIADGLRDLRQYLQQGRLVLFIGADLPEEQSGAPDRQALADRLAKEKGLTRGQRLAAIAQQVMASGNRFEFTQFLKQQLTGLQPGPFYHALAALVKSTLPQAVIITTSYHRLLESALESAGEYRLQVVTQDSVIPFLDTNAPVLYKLYGDIQQADLIVTEQDQHALIRGRARDRQELVSEVGRLFKRNSVLFLGVDLRDPVILALFDDVAGKQFQWPSFAVWTGMPEAERSSLESNRGLRLLEARAMDILEALT